MIALSSPERRQRAVTQRVELQHIVLYESHDRRAWSAGLQDENICTLRSPRTNKDDKLCEAVTRAERGLIDADLGGGVIIQRLPR